MVRGGADHMNKDLFYIWLKKFKKLDNLTCDARISIP